MFKTLLTVLALITNTNALISNFELDGNVLQDGLNTKDWSTLTSSSGGIFTGILADPAPQSIFTGGGSKDNRDITRWRHTDGSVPDKNDLTHAYAYGEQYNDDLYIFFGTDRLANDGDASIGFWFFQDDVSLLSNGRFTGQHQNGDILVLSNYGSSQEIQVYRWQDGTPVLVLSDAAATCDSVVNQSVCAITNQAPTDSSWSYRSKSGSVNEFPIHSFLEGGINLRQVFGGENVPCFTAFMAVSRSSSSLGAQLKDFVLGSFDVCDLGISIECTGVSLNSNQTGLEYSYTIGVENTGFGMMHDVKLSYDGTEVVTYPQLDVGESRQYNGTFDSVNVNETTKVASLAASKVPLPSSDYITRTAEPDNCPVIVLNPALAVNKTCSVSLENATGFLVVKVDFGGQVCNTGDIMLVNVMVADSPTSYQASLGSLSTTECAAYSSSYYPTDGRTYSDTVTVTGASAVGSYTTSDDATAVCTLC